MVKRDVSRTFGMIIIIAAVYVFLLQYGILNLLVPPRIAGIDVHYGLLFVFGLLTSAHCIAVCGGINLSQCMRNSQLSPSRSSVLYNLGRVIAYTIIGFIVGALGSVIAFSINTRAFLKLAAGIFMVVVGLNMLGIFPSLPFTCSKFFKSKLSAQRPFIVGLLSGLMPCGPLYAAQVYALATGSPLKGALCMMLFGLGTVPLMFGLGAFLPAAGKRISQKIVTAGAAAVTILGLCSLTRSYNLFGLTWLSFAAAPHSAPKIDIAFDIEPQVVNTALMPYRYPSIRVEPGRRVIWTIDVPEKGAGGALQKIIIREYGIEHLLTPGENVIEFMPNRMGQVSLTCWSGMFHGTITVAHFEETAKELRPDKTQTKGALDRCCPPRGAPQLQMDTPNEDDSSLQTIPAAFVD